MFNSLTQESSTNERNNLKVKREREREREIEEKKRRIKMNYIYNMCVLKDTTKNRLEAIY